LMSKRASMTGTNSEAPLETRRVALPVWEKRLAYALRNLSDRSKLNGGPLARLAYVERQARERCNGRLLARGLALHDILITCVEEVSAELGSDPGATRACCYLESLAQGLSCREISRRLGLSREHVSRVYRKRALELVTERFLLKIRNAGSPP